MTPGLIACIILMRNQQPGNAYNPFTYNNIINLALIKGQVIFACFWEKI